MFKLDKNLVLGFIVILLLWLIVSPKNESFDPSTTEFVPVGAERYGLRGDLLRRSDISKYYLNPNRMIRLHHTSNWMYPSNKSPGQEGVNGCKQVPCPTNTNEYDSQDTCWSCPPPARKTYIPDIHPH